MTLFPSNAHSPLGATRSARSQPCLPAMPSHTARAALAWLRLDPNRLRDPRPCRRDLRGYPQQPRPKLVVSFDRVPWAVTANDAIRRADVEFPFGQSVCRTDASKISRLFRYSREPVARLGSQEVCERTKSQQGADLRQFLHEPFCLE
jgi:hypothetical protein